MLICSSKGLERVLPASMEPHLKGTSAGEVLSPAMTSDRKRTVVFVPHICVGKGIFRLPFFCHDPFPLSSFPCLSGLFCVLCCVPERTPFRLLGKEPALAINTPGPNLHHH